MLTSGPHKNLSSANVDLWLLICSADNILQDFATYIRHTLRWLQKLSVETRMQLFSEDATVIMAREGLSAAPGSHAKGQI